MVSLAACTAAALALDVIVVETVDTGWGLVEEDLK